jgi:hypothetical protein
VFLAYLEVMDDGFTIQEVVRNCEEVPIKSVAPRIVGTSEEHADFPVHNSLNNENKADHIDMPHCEEYYDSVSEPWWSTHKNHSRQNAPIIANPLIARGSAFAHLDFGGKPFLEELVTSTLTGIVVVTVSPFAFSLCTSTLLSFARLGDKLVEALRFLTTVGGGGWGRSVGSVGVNEGSARGRALLGGERDLVLIGSGAGSAAVRPPLNAFAFAFAGAARPALVCPRRGLCSGGNVVVSCFADCDAEEEGAVECSRLACRAAFLSWFFVTGFVLSSRPGVLFKSIISIGAKTQGERCAHYWLSFLLDDDGLFIVGRHVFNTQCIKCTLGRES